MFERRWRNTPAAQRRDIAVKQCRIVVKAAGATIADAVVWLAVVFAGLLAWAPVTGLKAANKIVEARFRKRMQVEAQRILGGSVWSRHAQRQPLPGAARIADRVHFHH